MPKSKDKTKGAKKRRKSPTSAEVNTTESDGCNSNSGAKKKNLQKRSSIEGVDKSRKLQERLKRPRASRSSMAASIKEPKLCGNGIPMPSLSELEKMYEDSDGNDNPPVIKPLIIPDRSLNVETKPDTMIKDQITKIFSPNSLKKIASTVLNMISNAAEDDCPPSPIIPQKRPNRSGIPFIVGCKDRKQVPWAPKTSFCKGSPKYGVEPQDVEECKGENVGPHYANISKSIFNAQSEEIAERLKELERLESLGTNLATTTQSAACSGSPDSNKTVPYDFPDSPKSGPRSFSPLPSTSKDRETILKNDHLFNQSLKCESIHSNSSQEDVEIVEVPCETIIIDDTAPDKPKPEPMDVDIDPVDLDDDCCVIIESESNIKPKQISDSPIEINDEIYSSLDLTQGYDDNEVCEIIDVDNVISENRALLDKYRRESNLDSVILVEPNSTAINENTQNQETSNTNAFKELKFIQSYSNAPVLARVENTNSRNDIGDVVTDFFRRTEGNDRGANPTLGGNSTETEIIRTDMPSLDSNTTSNNSIDRILSWLLGLSGIITDSKIKRKPSKCQTNRELVQSNRLSSESNVESRLEPRPRTSTEVCDILTQALASANQEHTKHQQQRREPSPQQCSLQQELIDKAPKGLGDCPICMDNLSNNAIASTLCGHIFCMSCIQTAIKANGKRCPTCRKALKGVGYHQLFL